MEHAFTAVPTASSARMSCHPAGFFVRTCQDTKKAAGSRQDATAASSSPSSGGSMLEFGGAGSSCSAVVGTSVGSAAMVVLLLPPGRAPWIALVTSTSACGSLQCPEAGKCKSEGSKATAQESLESVAQKPDQCGDANELTSRAWELRKANGVASTAGPRVPDPEPPSCILRLLQRCHDVYHWTKGREIRA